MRCLHRERSCILFIDMNNLQFTFGINRNYITLFPGYNLLQITLKNLVYNHQSKIGG